MDNRHIEAHKYSSNHRKSLENDKKCGCFYCLKIFNTKEIEEWVDDTENGTAICPYCDIDSVIGESSGYPIEKEFLKRMMEYWF
ncbi:MAG: cytoplasmic protein [Romboutsia sp.]